jgi:peptidoglycan-associated lipoprotein
MRLADMVVLCVAALAPVGLVAQQRPELDVAVTYSAQRGTVRGGGDFWAQGGSAEVAATFYHGLGVVMNVAGTHASSISPSGVALTTVTSTFGPRYTWSHPLHQGAVKGFSLFGQTLIGVAQGLDSVFPSPAGAQSDAQDFALQVGGGADLLLSRHFAVRALQADWVRTQFPNGGSNVQNNLRLGAGLVFRLPK